MIAIPPPPACSQSAVPPAPSDEELVEAVIAGDNEAFNELDRRWRPRIRRYIAGKCNGSDDDIDDIEQEAFVRAFRQLQVGLRPPCTFPAFIYTRAKWAVSRYHARRGRLLESGRVSLDGCGRLGLGPVPVQLLDSSCESRAMARIDAGRLLRAVLPLLNPQPRRMFFRWLKATVGGSLIADVAKTLGETPRTVVNAASRARRAIIALPEAVEYRKEAAELPGGCVRGWQERLGLNRRSAARVLRLTVSRYRYLTQDAVQIDRHEWTVIQARMCELEEHPDLRAAALAGCPELASAPPAPVDGRIAGELREWRTRMGVSFSAAARALGCSKASLQSWERGELRPRDPGALRVKMREVEEAMSVPA